MYCCKTFLEVTLAIVTGLWGIVNNAEVPGKMGPLPWLLDRDFYRIFSVNIIGMAKVCSHIKWDISNNIYYIITK